MITEYGMQITANRLKRQYDQLADAEGSPIVIINCYPEGDAVAVTGTYAGREADTTVAISTSDQGNTRQLLEPGDELLVGYDTIDSYVESALELFETDGDLYAGFVAFALADKFPEHFPPVTEEVATEVAQQIVTCPDYTTHLVARDSGEIMRHAVERIMSQYIRSFPKALEALKDPVVIAYLAAWTDCDDDEAQLKLLIDIRS